MSKRVLKRVDISPLRYPGGKGKLLSRVRSIVRANCTTGSMYIEPYAGGAGLALALLVTGEVRSIIINDLDPAVHAFWKAITAENQRFIDALENIPLTVDEWRHQRSIYRSTDASDWFSLGFAFFYLNRTNRSGVLNGGPIGGIDQHGEYRIDARFNRRTLAERARLVGLYSRKISVYCDDGSNIIAEHASVPNSFVYADPPYVEKSGSLYMNSFREQDHRHLASILNSHAGSPWLLTYDDTPLVRELYADRRIEGYSLRYSANRVTTATEIMIFSDAMKNVL